MSDEPKNPPAEGVSRRRIFDALALASIGAAAVANRVEAGARRGQNRAAAAFQIRYRKSDGMAGRRRVGQGSHRRRVSRFAEHRGRFDAAEARRDPRTALARARRGMGVHAGGALPRDGDCAERAVGDRRFRARAIPGISRAGTGTRCRGSDPASVTSCSGSITATSRSTARSASPTGSRPRRPKS